MAQQYRAVEKKIVMSNKKFVKQRAKKREQRRYRNRKKNRAPESTVSASATKYITMFLSHTHTDVYVGTHGFLLTQERAVHSCNKGERARVREDRCVRVDPRMSVRGRVFACVPVCWWLRGRSLCMGLECVLGRSALTFRRGRAMVSRLLLRAG